jgi:hypothetical protein
MYLEYFQRGMVFARTEVTEEVKSHIKDKEQFDNHIKRQFMHLLLDEFQKNNDLPISELKIKDYYRGPTILFSTELHIFTPEDFQKFVKEVWDASRYQTINEINGGLNLT